MTLWTPSERTLYVVDNWTDPDNYVGQSVTGGQSNAEGSWAQLLSALSYEICGLSVFVHRSSVSSVALGALMDIGWDPAGGSSYTEKISNVSMGGGTYIASNHQYFFPIRIPSGATVACRIQTDRASINTHYVAVRAYGRRTAPWMLPVGQYAEQLGTITNSSGPTVAPGNGSWGSWTLIGTSSKECWWWQPTIQIHDATASSNYLYFELGYGDGTNFTTMLRQFFYSDTAERTWPGASFENFMPFTAYKRLPASTNLYVRGFCNTTPNTDYTCTVIGIGG